jgi:hypothetical protein
MDGERTESFLMTGAAKAHAQELLKAKLSRDLQEYLRNSGSSRFEYARLLWLGNWLIDHMEPRKELVPVPPIVQIIRKQNLETGAETGPSDAPS